MEQRRYTRASRNMQDSLRLRLETGILALLANSVIENTSQVSFCYAKQITRPNPNPRGEEICTAPLVRGTVNSHGRKHRYTAHMI